MSTIDDNPGTGRILDKYIYQALGRLVERWIRHITISDLSSEKIVQDMKSTFFSGGFDILDDLKQHPINQITQFILEVNHGDDIVYGLKILIERAR